MSNFKELKVKILSNDHAVKVQAKLFDLGYAYNSGKLCLDNLEGCYLFTDTNGSITWHSSKHFFNDSTVKEVIL